MITKIKFKKYQYCYKNEKAKKIKKYKSKDWLRKIIEEYKK